MALCRLLVVGDHISCASEQPRKMQFPPLLKKASASTERRSFPNNKKCRGEFGYHARIRIRRRSWRRSGAWTRAYGASLSPISPDVCVAALSFRARTRFLFSNRVRLFDSLAASAAGLGLSAAFHSASARGPAELAEQVATRCAAEFAAQKAGERAHSTCPSLRDDDDDDDP